MPVVVEEEVEVESPVAEFEFEPPPVAEFESPMAEEYEQPASRESRRLSHKVSDRSELTRLLQFMRFILRITPYVIRGEMVGVTLLMLESLRLMIRSSDGSASSLALGSVLVVGIHILIGLLVYVGTIVTMFCIRVQCELLEMLLHREVLFVAIANNTAKE